MCILKIVKIESHKNIYNPTKSKYVLDKKFRTTFENILAHKYRLKMVVIFPLRMTCKGRGCVCCRPLARGAPSKKKRIYVSEISAEAD